MTENLNSNNSGLLDMLTYFKKHKLKVFLFSLLFVLAGSRIPDEGMFPLSEIPGLNLKEAGLKIDVKDIYNPDGVSLIDALVKLNGCTGSFVSDDGLILTNHHCAFDFVAEASTVENNYLENGFIANDRGMEIPAKGMTCKITVGYSDVSSAVLAAAEGKEGSDRINAINKARKMLVDDAQKEPGIKAEVAEMFIGKTWVLFKYRELTDVRLVYVPARAIGNFGGETDNWVWPRHTGDFAFLRAYVAPDGSPRGFNKENVPYKPKKFLKVNPDGVKENDFVFVLGYPGVTYRNRPSEFLKLHRDVRLPYTQQLFAGLIAEYEKLSESNPAWKLKLDPQIKSLANTEKNFRGKLVGFNKVDIIPQKEREEAELEKFIASDPQLKAKYSGLMAKIKKEYEPLFKLTSLNTFGVVLSRFSTTYQLGELITEYMEAKKLPDDKRPNIFKEKNKSQLLATVDELFANYIYEADLAQFKVLITDASKRAEFSDVAALQKFFKGRGAVVEAEDFFRNKMSKSELMNKDYFLKALEMSPDVFEETNDPLVTVYREFDGEFAAYAELAKNAEGNLNALLADFIEVKKQFMERSFIPDANSTLRLTYGYIKGYAPADATYYKPFTTLSGVIEKGISGNPDYELLPKIKELWQKKDYGRFKDETLGDLPVAILYNLDTTGGNSGSPVLDAWGRVIGLNFDRAFGATINDYAWSEDYSRSIGVDIRYVLWNVAKVGGAPHILTELGVN